MIGFAMPHYTMRRAFFESQDDFVFRADGKDAGRCYQHLSVDGQVCWHWTVYGSRASGDEPRLEDAQARFKGAYEQKDANG